jgi:adenosylhomocysteine nucleosidase
MILIVAAMQSEVSEMIKHPKNDVEILITGVGKVNAARALTEILSTKKVSKIYNFGFAGATNPYQIGQIVCINEAIYHDFDLTVFGYQKGQVPGHPEVFKTDNSLIKSAKNRLLNITFGKLFTGDYFVTDIPSEPMIVDMEGTALYQVAHHYQIPIISFKVISDLIGMEKHLENYRRFEEQEGADVLLKLYLYLFEGE